MLEMEEWERHPFYTEQSKINLPPPTKQQLGLTFFLKVSLSPTQKGNKTNLSSNSGILQGEKDFQSLGQVSIEVQMLSSSALMFPTMHPLSMSPLGSKRLRTIWGSPMER
uniref:Uncharacterized protein n=1 Tax=Arcella intermedia TaxID=1963864 RepID=A0A6B2LI25_9EUKA